MRIGVIGWYGHENYGDERMLMAIKHYFASHEVFVACAWKKAYRSLSELNKCDYVLIGGGGFTLNTSGLAKKVLLGLKVPFSAIGISIEVLHTEMKEFIETLIQRADIILVRNKKSKEIIDSHQKVLVGPDLTFLYPFKVRSVVNEDTCGLSLRNWFWWNSANWGQHHKFMLFLDKKIPGIKKFYPGRKWELSKVLNVLKKNFLALYPIPFYFEHNSIYNDVNILREYFKNVPESFDISLYDEIRYLVGMRFHSIVFAIQCGIPFLSLSYQSKNSELCSDLRLEKLSFNIYEDFSELRDKIEYLKTHYSEIRSKILEYRKNSINKIENIFDTISKIMIE